MATGARDGRAGILLILIGAIVQFVIGALLVMLGLYLAGVLGGAAPPTDRQNMGWMFIGIGAVSVIGGEVGLRAFRAGRAGRLRAAWTRGLLASMLPPVQLVTLIGAILCKLAADQRSDGAAPDESHPFKL